MGFDVDVDGFTDAIEELKDLEEDLGQRGEWIVGTSVSYGIYVEYGTRYMQAQPYFRPALAELRARGVDGFIEDHTRKSLEEIDDVDELVKTVAFALERRVSELAPVDTGTLRSSVKAVRGTDVSSLPDESEVDASADVEVTP